MAVVENFSPDPDALRATAAVTAFGPAGRHFPGIRACVPPFYLASVTSTLGAVAREVFGATRAMGLLDVSFSIVTAPPSALSIEQRMPHVDALEPGRLALVHYLDADAEDGTAFYRHRATGFETVDAQRSATYFSALNEDLQRHGRPPAAYLAGDTPIFERVAAFEGRYNRAVIYRGRLLHCGDIPAGRILSDDPARGRLTVTGFFAGR